MKLNVEEKVETKKKVEETKNEVGIKVLIIEGRNSSKETYIIPEHVCRYEGHVEGMMFVWLSNSPVPLRIAMKVEDFIKEMRKQ